MPGLDILLPFLAATVVFAILPGPAMLYTSAQTLAHGRRGGYMAALGIHIGGLAHVAGAALGLSALFSIVPTLFDLLKILGALYLVWIGIQIIRARGSAPDIHAQPVRRNGRRAFLQSMTVEILNPKTALFFIAFLPQFADPAATLPIWAQMLILGTIVNLSYSAADLVVVSIIATTMNALNKAQRLIAVTRWAGGSILIGLGVHLAITDR